DYNLTVRPPAADPVSVPAAKLFNEKIAVNKNQCQGYVNMLERAGRTLEQNARAYLYTDQEVTRSLASYEAARQPQWDEQARSRDASHQLPQLTRSLPHPGQPSPPTPPPLPGMFNGAQ